jgi:hypothetical protein
VSEDSDQDQYEIIKDASLERKINWATKPKRTWNGYNWGNMEGN